MAHQKRPRLDEPETAVVSLASATVTRGEDFWFDDGSVILALKNNLFRVHRTILSTHSEIFADMFKIPQSDHRMILDGCPVFHLSDSVDDFCQLLKAIYNPLQFFEPYESCAPIALIPVISTILRLSTKYGIQSLRQKTINLFKAHLPCTFTAYDSLSSLEAYRSPEFLFPVVRLAREVDVPQILPLALYHCARLHPAFILRGTSLDRLSSDDAVLCMLGREKLFAAQAKHTHPFLYAFLPALGCSRAGACKKPGPLAMDWHSSRRSRDSLLTMQTFTQWESLGLCAACLPYAKTLNQEGRKVVWEMLPEIFELGKSWEEIGKAQNN